MKLPYKWDTLMRYRLIEIIALWEGRVTANHLCDSFGIGRQQAWKIIQQYMNEIAPHNLIMDASAKGYIPTAVFQPVTTTGTADEYLHLLSRNKDIAHTFDSLALNFAHTEIVQAPVRTIAPEVLRKIVQACRNNLRLDCEYISMTSGKKEGRIIAPHTLICTPLRWHVRAYCEYKKEFRDFVLSRFAGELDLMSVSSLSKEDDDLWNTAVSLKIIPDPRLSAFQKSIVAKDFGMTRNVLRIETRAPLVEYVLKSLNITPQKPESTAIAQQIVIGNYHEIKAYLFTKNKK